MFKEGNFEAAYDLYSEALTIDPNNIKTNAKLYCNRATVGSKVRNIHWADVCVHLGGGGNPNSIIIKSCDEMWKGLVWIVQ